ncbi:MAG: glycosyltransferase 87 family protein, partial [Chloroflexota bacterium]
MFKDLDIFLRAAAAILQGSDPYSIAGLEVFYPLPFYFLFIPLASLPAPVVYALWSALSASILIAILRQRVVWVAFSMPVLLTFLLGQVDVVMLALYVALRSSIAAGLALAFLVLKPQLVLLLAPWMLWHWWRHARRQIILFGVVLGVIVLLSFVIQPDWIARFFARSGERTRAAISSSVWGVLAFLPSPWWLIAGALASGGLIVWAWRKDDFDLIAAAGLLISPY